MSSYDFNYKITIQIFVLIIFAIIFTYLFAFTYLLCINHRAECYTLSKLQPQEASPAEGTDSSMATFVQLEQTSTGHFGSVDSGSDRNTAGHSICNSGWTSGTGGYTIRAYIYIYTCDCVLAAYKLPSCE